jgi:hypothetical protein
MKRKKNHRHWAVFPTPLAASPPAAQKAFGFMTILSYIDN